MNSSEYIKKERPFFLAVFRHTRLFVMLFLSADNRCANGCTAADNQQRKPQCGVGGVAGAQNRGNRLHRRLGLHRRRRLRGHSGLRGCRFRRLCLDGELSCCRTVLRNDRKRMLAHRKRGNKITVQRDDGAALLLRVVLFVQRSAIKLYTKEIGKGCVRSERQLLFLALRDCCTITGCDFRGSFAVTVSALAISLVPSLSEKYLPQPSQYQYSMLPSSAAVAAFASICFRSTWLFGSRLP